MCGRLWVAPLNGGIPKIAVSIAPRQLPEVGVVGRNLPAVVEMYQSMPIGVKTLFAYIPYQEVFLWQGLRPAENLSPRDNRHPPTLGQGGQ
jgi:hypothetical protein